MKLKNASAKIEREAKRTHYVSIGFVGVLFVTEMLFTILMLNYGVASPDNISVSGAVNVSASSVVKVSDSQTLMANGASADAQLHFRTKRATPFERKAAAERFKEIYKPAQYLASAEGILGASPTLDPGGIPHYFGPYANWANSPMPKGVITSITVTDGGTGYTAPVVTVTDAYNNSGVTGPTVSVTLGTGGVITGIRVTDGGTGYTAPVVVITDPNPAATGAVATATIGGTPTGGIRKFVDTLPGLTVANRNNLQNYIPVAIPDKTTYPPGGVDYTSAPAIRITDGAGTGATATANMAGSTVGSVTVTNGGSGYSANPTVTFVGGGAATQAIGKATVVGGVITGITLVGCDYYEIELGEYTQKLHSDLPATKLRGYRQTNTNDATVSQFHYLGPLISAQSDRPVRIKFTNNLPTGAGGDLFIPVDTTVMGSGMGPNMAMATGATSAGTTATITTENPHNFQAGQRVMLHGFKPDAYNGTFLVLPTSLTATQFQVTLKTNPGGSATTLGEIMEMYTENRAAVHLHGGNTPWISDGTPHQWTTPATENTHYPEGVSVTNVPDMDNGVEPTGTLTFYYTNQQSARLMFYHDHAYGITRLNVYAGEAAGYLLTDQVEQDLINGTDESGVNPTGAKPLIDEGIPLIIQDRTFVDSNTIAVQDPTWNWGTGARDPVTGKILSANTGDLWMPHVYMTNQNPWDITGTNAFGRWMYSPWFWPPATPTERGLIPNPYYTGGSGTAAPWEPPMIPGTPNPSMAMEAFMDTPLINGAAYPSMTVDPKAYRFRILNAANERFLNLQMYQASSIIRGITVINGGSGYTAPLVTITDPAPGKGVGATATATIVGGVITGITLLTVGSNYFAPVVTITDPTGTGASATADIYTGLTEVGMVPATKTSGYPAGWPTDGREGGVPDPAKKGPSFYQIGTEGGFLPAPVVVQNQPVTYIGNAQAFNFGNVDKHALLLGPAERADVIIDFSQYAGKTLILYNDAPAAFPAADPRVDYYTNDVDQRDTGGAPTTQPGYGPNTRTVMQIKVNATPTVNPFVRGTDGSLWYRNWDGTSWKNWQSLGGYITNLDTVSSGSNVFAFGQGGDNALWYRNWDGTSWSNWQSLGGYITNLDAVSSGRNILVFAQGGDNALWYRNWDGISWSTWQSLGGYITKLDAVSSGNNVLVFAQGGDNGLWYRNWDGTSWGNWQSLGGYITKLDAVSSGNNVFAFAQGGDNALWYRNWDGTSWGNWQSLGGYITKLDAVSSGNNVFAFAQGGDNALRYRNWDGTSWGNWQSLGGYITNLAAVSSGNNVFAFAQGGDNALWYRNWDGTSWGNWQSLGSYITNLDAVSSGGSNIAPLYDLASLNAAFANTTGKKGVFSESQPPIIMPQAAYNSAYNKTFTPDIAKEYVQLFEFSHTFQNISGSTLTLPLQPKALHDEMNAAYDTEYGRMSGMLGLEMLSTNPLTQNFMLYGYPSPPVEVINDSMTPMSEPSAADGTQIWKITHNGVDTHTYHFHLYNVQLINRVAWDGILIPPDDNELGWKETVRTNPLEHTIVALRPAAPRLPFKVPNSTRLIDPTKSAGAILQGPPGGFLDPASNPVTVSNHLVNFGWEYVIHCHLLGHEEMDMMHAQVFAVAPEAPSDLHVTSVGRPVILVWTDNSISETGFTIQRAIDAGFTTDLTTFTVKQNIVTYTDATAASGTTYYYRVRASNQVGDTAVYTPPAVGFPHTTVTSEFSNTVTVP